MPLTPHPILLQSFALIDQEIGDHSFSPEEYQVVRRVIHSTADFEFKELIRFSPGVIAAAIAALQTGAPIITDVTMVRQGVITLVQQVGQNPLICAVESIEQAQPGQTRTETGLRRCLKQYPSGIYVIGNAPTALLALCDWYQTQTVASTPIVIGAPVGFINVLESKAALAATDLQQIRIDGRKGGSPVAAAILNALLWLAFGESSL